MIESTEKLVIKYDKSALNTIELIVYGESHTLANMVRDKVLEDTACTFCAYKVTHSHDNFVSLRVSALESKPVRIVILESLKALSREISDLINQLRVD